MQQIIRLFPLQLRDQIEKSGVLHSSLEEIRVRVNQYLTFLTSEGEFFLHDEKLVSVPDASCVRMRREDLDQMCTFMSNYSLYAFEEEIKQGFLTVEGGHRIGICGQVSAEGGQIRRIHPISYLNIRIAGERKGCAKRVFPELHCGTEFLDTLILSAPGIGKTTLLRDLVRLLSNGDKTFAGKKIGLVDERSEIAGSIRGIPQNDVGTRTDVLDGCPKEAGMMLLVRSMSPEVLAVDEIGGQADMEALRHAVRCGCRILATIHSRDVEELWKKPGWDLFRKENLFQRYVVLTCAAGVREYRVFDAEGRLICTAPDNPHPDSS